MAETMADAYIIDAVRSPVGRRGGGLAGAHPADLGAHVIAALLARTGIDPADVDDVVFGCVDTVGPQAGDIARTAWLAAGLPESVPGVTVDRQCGSSQQAVHFAAQAVLSGTADLVVASNRGPVSFELAAVATALRERLSSYKIPRHLRLVEESDLPRLPTGKVDLVSLRDLFKEA